MTGPISLFPTPASPTDSLQKPLLVPPPSGERRKLSLFPDTQQESAEDARLRQARRLSQATPPDSASRIMRLQLQTGLPRELIAQRLDEVESLASQDAFDPVAYRQKAPIVASWMSENPDHAALAKDDLEQLGRIEGYFTALNRGVQRGRQLGETSTIGQRQREDLGYLAPADSVRLSELEKELARDLHGRNFMQDVLYNGGEFVGQMVDMAPEVAGYGLTGATVGAAIGAIGGPAAPITSSVGAGIGGTVGVAYGTVVTTFRMEGGLAYRELSKIRGPNGE